MDAALKTFQNIHNCEKKGEGNHVEAT